MRVIVSPEYLSNLQFQFPCDSLAMRTSAILYLLEVPQLIGDISDMLLVFSIDGSYVLQAALLLIADYMVLCL